MNALYETLVDTEVLSIRMESTLTAEQNAAINLAVQLSLEMALAELDADPLFHLSDDAALGQALQAFHRSAEQHGWCEEGEEQDPGYAFLGSIQRCYAAEAPSESEPKRIGFCCGIELALDEGPEFGAIRFLIHRRVIDGRLEHVIFLLQSASRDEQQALKQNIAKQRCA